MEDAAGVSPVVEAGWLAWEVPGKPVSVRLSADAAGRLRMAVWEGFKSLRRRGLETGGLLIGTTREVGDRVVVEVDDFEPVESVHASGPSYVLSETDFRELEARIAAREDPEVPSVVGFYRSHTRHDFAITPEDAALFARYFPARSHVFLLIKANDDGPPTGGFIIREGGKVLSTIPYQQFPLPLTASVSTVREPGVPAFRNPQPQPKAAPAAAPAAVRATAAAWKTVRPVWLAVAAVVVLAVAVPFGLRRRGAASVAARPGAQQALNVTIAGNSLRLSWDRQTSLQAGKAVLWIEDGPDEQHFTLDSRQLTEGSVVYWPRHSDVNFRLELLSAGAAVTESVRAIGGPSNAEGTATEPVRAVRKPAPRPAARPETLAAPSTATATAPNAARPTQTSARQVAAQRPAKPSRRNRKGSASRAAARAFVPPQPATGSSTVALAGLPDAPAGRPLTAATEHSADLLKGIAPASDPDVDGGPNSVRVSVEPASASLLEHLGRGIPLLGKRYRHPDYVPPSPIRRPALLNPPNRQMAGPVSIDVKVYVDPAGKVDTAEVLSKVSPTDRDLAALAMFSARRWEFSPARTGEGTVPGAVIIHYQFGSGARAVGRQSFVAH